MRSVISNPSSYFEVKPFKFCKSDHSLEVLDQRFLPNQIVYTKIANADDGYKSIVEMQVRGAPCIALVGCLSLVVELNGSNYAGYTFDSFVDLIKSRSSFIKQSRPTAVNLSKALDKLNKFIETVSVDLRDKDNESAIINLKQNITSYCIKAIDIGVKLNRRLGDFGAQHLLESQISTKEKNLFVLTHCNTGSLATVDYGTALGVIRSLKAIKRLEHVFCTETRPYNQGSRLTSFELVSENIPSTLIVDSAVAYLMNKRQVDVVIVGADAVAENGDTANKIGTYQIATLAQRFSIPFYVAMPSQTLSIGQKNSDSFKIEERPADELKKFAGVRLAPESMNVWNPSFDITPGDLITGFITEYGVFKSNQLEKLKQLIMTTSDEEQGLF